jgi:hypothetical protein
LKSLIKKKFSGHSDVAEAIDQLEAKPDSGGRRRTVLEELEAANSTSDPELVSAAQSLFKLIRALPQGEKLTQVAQGTGIAQPDRGSTATLSADRIPLHVLGYPEDLFNLPDDLSIADWIASNDWLV